MNTFFGPRPLEGLQIRLDGDAIGETGRLGEISTALEAGQHRLQILKDGAKLSEYEFIVATGESADISITFTDFSSDPKIKIATYDSGVDGAGPTGTIQGQVTSSNGQAIGEARVVALGTDAQTTTKADGSFVLSLPRGTYELDVSHPEYRAVSKDGLRVVANIAIATKFTLRPAVTDESTEDSGYTADIPAEFADVEEVEVIGTFNPNEQGSELEKFSVAITDSISIEDLLRFGDSDVASALKRIVGVAVTGGKYANVRGLDGRYISSTLNAGLMPSTDPFRRDVQLDLFPSEILGGIEIQKSFTSDLPGDTTGGIIRMTSKEIPTEDETGLSFSVGLIQGATGEDLFTYGGSDTDVLGFDDGLRELPGDYRANLSNGNFRFRICQFEGQTDCVQQSEAVRLAGLFPVIYTPERETATPNFGVAGKIGRRIEMATGDFGFYGSATYDQGFGSRQDAAFDDADAVGTTDWDTFTVSANGYFVAGWESEQGWDITSKTMWLRDSEDRTTIESGFNKKDDVDELITILEWVERQFIGQQFDGTVSLFNGHTLDARLGFTQTNRLSPDRREYQYRNNVFIASTLERSYADLTEDGVDFGLDYLLPYQFNASIYSSIRFGLMTNARERDNELIRVGVLDRNNPELDKTQDLETLLVRENFENDSYRLNTNKTTETDSYDASQDLSALYVSTETDIGDAWTVVAGLRQENYEIDLNYPNDANGASSTNSDRDSTELLPTLSGIYRLGREWQFRAGFSQTVSRPNITELADSRFFDQEGRQFIGCPNCVDSSIDNFDVRAEWYFDTRDSLSLALFYKTIDQPLERAVSDGSGSAVSALTFRNSDSATLQGIEFDASKRVWDGIDNVVTLSGNISIIDSEISLDANGRRLEGINDRELQGQSPLLANFQVALDNYEWDARATLVMNYFDDRIDAVARAPLDPIFESGRLDVNITADKTFRNDSKISLKLKNLLDEAVERTQGGRVIETYKKGLSLSLGYSLSF